jgi:hypothetical protein
MWAWLPWTSSTRFEIEAGRLHLLLELVPASADLDHEEACNRHERFISKEANLPLFIVEFSASRLSHQVLASGLPLRAYICNRALDDATCG